MLLLNHIYDKTRTWFSWGGRSALALSSVAFTPLADSFRFASLAPSVTSLRSAPSALDTLWYKLPLVLHNFICGGLCKSSVSPARPCDLVLRSTFV